MTVLVQVDGLKALDAALAELPKTIAKGVLKRVLVKAGEPIADAARSAVPVKSGKLRDSIKASATIKNKVGKAEYSAALRAGLDKAAARQALRDARRAAGPSSFAELYIGPARGKGVIRYAHIVEFGKFDQPAQPYMRPAWDSNKDGALRIIRTDLGTEIIAAAKRIGRSKRYGPDIKYQASMAALLAHEAG